MNLPDKVYKYRIWENGSHKNLLLYNELYLASPKDFNDPFDCRISPNFVDLTKQEKNDYINDLAISRYKECEDKGLDFEEVLKNFELGRGRKAQRTEILFIEKCLDLLKASGRMGIVLPDGILTNSTLQYVRDFRKLTFHCEFYIF